MMTTTTEIDDIISKLGLDVVPKKKKQENKKKNKKKITKIEPSQKAVPTIIWGEKAKRFFWNDDDNKRIRYYSSYTKRIGERKRQIKVESMNNHQNFPLYRIHNVLSEKSLQKVLSIVNDNKQVVEELEQHERSKNNEIKTIRRSLVSRLTYTSSNQRQIIDTILSGLPSDLVEGMKASAVTTTRRTEEDSVYHPYEDGSIVYYRTNSYDFYNEHHDSYDPKEKKQRKRHRAYTILFYLRVPSEEKSGGGTEFSKLTTTNNNTPFIMKPKAGDALVWPNFDIDGKPYMDSIHKALPIITNSKKNEMSRTKEIMASKIVINLWFEGLLSS